MMHKQKKKNENSGQVVSSHNVFSENRFESSYPREPFSPVPASLLLDVRQEAQT